MSDSDFGQLYIVSTPIGNLEDISHRAIHVLSTVDVIAAEDTRHSGRLLSHYSIPTKTVAFHDHNEKQKVNLLLSWLESGKNIALISDAGTPLINDPGYTLVSACRERGIQVSPVPGASAVIAALSCSALPSDRFAYWGFTPAKRQARQQFYAEMNGRSETVICYESPHRIMDSLNDLRFALGADTKICFAKELTKTFETFKTQRVEDVIAWLEEDTDRQRGEIVILVSPPKVDESVLSAQANSLLVELVASLPVKQAATLVADAFGLKKNAVYKHALALKEANSE